MMANEGQWRPDLLKGCLYGAPLWESLWTFEGYIEPRSPALQLDSLPSEPLGKPVGYVNTYQKNPLPGRFEFFLCV